MVGLWQCPLGRAKSPGACAKCFVGQSLCRTPLCSGVSCCTQPLHCKLLKFLRSPALSWLCHAAAAPSVLGFGLSCPALLQEGTGAHPVALDEFEAHDVLQLPQADGAGLQGPQQSFIQAQGSLHDALQPAARPQPHQVADLVTGHLSGKQRSEQCVVISVSAAPSSSSSAVRPSLLPGSLTQLLLWHSSSLGFPR